MNEPMMQNTNSPSALLAAIRRFEVRLQELDGGDCAYEKALARSYEQGVTSHRERLASLRRVNS